MATKSEKYRAAAERHAAQDSAVKKSAKRSKPGSPPAKRSRARKAAGRKASYALEGAREGRPSRKSTRKSANRSKPDTNLTLRAGRDKGSPKARARKANAEQLRARGGGTSGKRVASRGEA
jgi:hypothetical protein